MESPVYIQIHNQLKKDIEAGKWSIGDRIPSERELALNFEVSRMTLRQAVQTLVDEGILERRIGAGTYVANRKVQEKMSGVTSFTDLMTAQGKTPSSKTISFHIANPSLSEAEKLQLKDGEQVLRMERIRYADNVPICFEVATVPQSLVADFSKAEITSSFYKTLEEKGGYQMGGAQQTVSAQPASERIAEYLDIKRNGSILRLRQVSFLNDGTPFEYVRTQYVGERFEFYLER
ncbi:GntR family transcriptional regulator [Latilactobacillus sakei subsp. carnosus]|uniref:GntR family transcriptional regulator n=1 Tax=Latilactobacillus TaxID=2767885 RepID=UPI000C126A4D|nr:MULTISPECIES: GntR family transcriptional regulator [Latilactobacillus]MCM1571411.1 GntR family transcriptional regulator [Latilactobacillus sakei]MDV8938064.1 GntR family transcriptional regulator [Latilactobacillus sp.]MDV8939863.1 GntR family transcriptional regulator [Latilactobacillus sp.]MDV8941647.1 GntR family transcriptional regulator [Latilactobacillus sp.]MDV8943369.1 GntR family transcriptional regulator [Latilactobacillus sp.]